MPSREADKPDRALFSHSSTDLRTERASEGDCTFYCEKSTFSKSNVDAVPATVRRSSGASILEISAAEGEKT